MAQARIKAGRGGVAPVLFAAAIVAFALPTAGLAVTGLVDSRTSVSTSEFVPFTPATVDPQLARRVAASLRDKGEGIRFTPASVPASPDRTYTVAVRVDDQTARSISIRSAIADIEGPQSARKVAIAPTRYNLGIARGYQGFVKAPTSAKTETAQSQNTLGLRNLAMPDLAEFKPAQGIAKDKPSRFQPRIAMESERGTTGRSEGTLEALGEQSVDLGGAYRVSRNLDVTAGVRLSQDRDRIAPLTDSVQDSQAVYVGTQFRF